MAEGDGGDPNEGAKLYSLPSGTMCGGCQIVRPLGAGGYSEVYLAVDPEGRQCAVKRQQLANVNDHKTRRRFLQEARLLGNISHPNVVGCDGYGAEADGTLWMKLEYLQGCTVRELLRRHGTLPIELVLRLGRQVCAGLNEIHQARVAHRDIKPDNLFFIEEIDLLKVLDFGLVKLPGSGIKTTGRFALGTALYFAPDYLKRNPALHGDEPDVRWDVYSLAMTLYEMLAGHPFVLALGEIPPPMVAAKMHLMHEIPDLTEHGIPAFVAAPIMRALSFDPNDRPGDAAAFGLELRQALETWRAVRAGETPAPRTASARVRLGEATTEPEVVSQLARSTALPASEALRAATDAPSVQTTSARAAPAVAHVTGRVVSLPVPAPSTCAASDSSRTEPLDRSELHAPPPALPPALPPAREAPEAGPTPTTAACSEEAVSARTAPPNEHPAALPASELERDLAELAFWMKTGDLPPDVAAKLGPRIRELFAPRLQQAPSAPSTSDAANEPAAQPVLTRPTTAAAWRARWETTRRPAALLALLLACGLLVYVIARRGTALPSSPSAQAEGPITVPLPVEPATPAQGPPAGGASEPAAPEPAATATATSRAAQAAAPAVTATPKSSRANDIYTSLDGEDELPPPKAASKPKTTKASPKPSSTRTIDDDEPPKPVPTATSILPFGKAED